MKKFTKKERSWAMYDWANSAFTLVIITSIMPIYFKSSTKDILSDATSTFWWGMATSFGTLALALCAPILGSICAYKGVKRKIFKRLIQLGVLFTALIAIIPSDNWWMLLMVYVIAFLCFEATIILYDSYIVDVTEENRMNRVSAYGFAMGYIGSVIPFIICISLIILLPDYKLAATKVSFIITAIWWGIFSLPLLKNVNPAHEKILEEGLFSNSFRQLTTTAKSIYKNKTILLFLLAFFFYIDGVNTIIAMAAPFAKDIGMDSNSLLILIFIIQVIAVPFAILYGKLADLFHAKPVIYFGICTYIVLCVYAYFVHSAFGIYVIAFLIGTAQGGIQALSRAYFGKIVPKEHANEYFGFFSVFSKFAAVIGPLLVGVTTGLTGSANKGVLSLVVLFVMGGVLFYFVPRNPSDEITNRVL